MSTCLRTTLAALAAVLVAALGGCATGVMTDRDRAMLAGRYAELEQRAEAEVPDLRSAKTVKLAQLCMAYAKLKRYNKLQPCLDRLEANVAAGDTNMTDVQAMQSQSPMLMGFARLGSAMAGVKLEQDVTPHLWELRAETWMDLGEPRRAIDYGRKMYAGIPTQWNLERVARIHALGILALSNALAGERAEALKRAQELEEVSTAYPYVLLKTEKLVYLARTYIALGDYPRAYEFAGEDDNSVFRGFADAVSGGATLQGGSLFAYQQIQRAFIKHKSALEIGRIDEARAGYDEMLANPATRENGDLYWIVLHDRGRIAERDGKAGEAAELYKQAVEVIERQRSSLNTEASKIGFVGNKQSVYRDLIRTLVARARVAEAFGYVERSKSRALVDMLAAKKDFAAPAAATDQVRALLAQADSADREARALVVPEGQKRTLVASARTQLAAQAPELASLLSVTALESAEVQKRIPADEMLVEYYYGEGGAELYAFVVQRDLLRVQVLAAAGLAEEIRAFRVALQTPASDAWRAPAQALYARLLRPLEPFGKERITIVAHGALHYLPFNALHDGSRFLVERAALRMLPAASVLQFLKDAAGAKPGQLLALGNPDLGDPRLDLAFAQAEAEAIAARMPSSRALVRKQATKAAFAKYSPGFRFLHIASHGEFDADAPLNSALRLAPEGGDDGALTVGELYSMRIDADLVTLSACETGLGKIANGDDVVGLTRGFLYAGARSIVASLWQVDDRATEALMTGFYDALRAGTDKRGALRQAQILALKSAPHPYYWAAFQLTGKAD